MKASLPTLTSNGLPTTFQRLPTTASNTPPYTPMVLEHPTPGLEPRQGVPTLRPPETASESNPVPGKQAAFHLRPYQAAGIKAVSAYLGAGGRAGLAVWPTGAGKSVLLATLAQQTLAAGGRTLILAHIGELIDQNAAAVARMVGAPQVGVFSSGLGKRQADRPVTVASIQSVFRQAQRLGRQDLVVVDEAHLISPEAGSGMYRQLLDGLAALGGPVPLIGLTATPWRLTSGRLDRPWRGNPPLFEKIVHEIGIRDLISDGYLCRPIAKATRICLEADGVSVRQGEYAAGELQAAINVDAINRDIVAEIIERGRDRRAWLVFATGVQHALNLAERLGEAGVTVAAIDGTMPATERAATITAFKRGELRALVSMNVLTTGFDAPAVDLIALCRPTLSPGLHVQMIGRGTRLSPTTGKTDCLVLDFARNCLRHGPLDLIDGSSLGKSLGGGQAPAKACPACSTIVATATRICPDCGFVFQFEPKETKLTTSPHAARLLSTDAEIPAEDWREVLGGTYKRHERDGKPAIFQINYLVANRTIPISEWLAFEGPNETARRIARAKWRDRAGTQPPETTADAIGRTRELPKPKAIRVTPSAKNPNYLEVKAVSFEPRRAAA